MYHVDGKLGGYREYIQIKSKGSLKNKFTELAASFSLIFPGVGPQQPIEIIYKTLKYCARKGLKRPFLGPKYTF